MSGAPRRAGRWFWGGFFGVLLVLLAVSLLALLRTGADWVRDQLAESALPPVLTEAVRVTLAPGESVYLDAQTLFETRAQVLAVLDERVEEVREGLAVSVDAGLAPIFAAAEGQIPAFADWYYSLTGEYTRLAAAAFGSLAELLTERLDELVFGPAGMAEALDALTERLGAEAVSGVQEGAREVQAHLLRLARSKALPAEAVAVAADWAPGERLGIQLAPFAAISPEDIAAHGAAASAGVAAGAAVGGKLGGAAVAKAATSLAAKPSAGAAGALLAKLGVKSAAKAGGAMGAAGSGAALGAALCTGTVAGAAVSPACALVGGVVSGVAAWLLVDKAVVEADEHLHREGFEAALREALNEQRDLLRAELVGRYAEGAAAVLKALRTDLETELSPRPIAPPKDFVPARAGIGD